MDKIVLILSLMFISFTVNANSSFDLQGTIQGTQNPCKISMKDRELNFESYTLSYSSQNQQFSEVYGVTLESMKNKTMTSYRIKSTGNQFIIPEGGADIFSLNKYYRFEYQLINNQFYVRRNTVLALIVGTPIIATSQEVCNLN